MGTITNYSSLLQAITDWVDTPEIEQIADQMVQFVEADLNSRLRCREMIVRARTTSDAEYVRLPVDWAEAINLQIIDGVSPLRFVTLDESDIIKKQRSYTAPGFYSLMDGAIELVPAPADDLEIEMVYYGKIPALTTSNTTNWLLSKAPDVYLYGALTHAAPFLKNDARLQTFGQIYLARVASLQEESQKSMHSGSPLIARTRRAFS
jgi:hypothetical protein